MNCNKLRGLIAEKRFSLRQAARAIGITEKSMYLKMESGRFWLDEARSLAQLLNMSQGEMMDIFFDGLEA